MKHIATWFFLNLICYVIGSIIAFDNDPTHWKLFTTDSGLIAAVFIEVLILKVASENN